MKVTLPRDRVIDLNNIPPNFEELILDELNIFTDESEFLSLDFMGECYELGRKNATLYDKYIANDYHDSEKIMELEVRAIKAIINYEKVEEHSNDKVLQD